MYENQIEEVPLKLFQKNRKLKELRMRGNKIRSIPIGLLDPLTELEFFSISSNELEVIHPNTFQQNKKLKRLYLGSNKIGAICENTYDDLTKLTYLNMKNNSCIDKDYGVWGSKVLARAGFSLSWALG